MSRQYNRYNAGLIGHYDLNDHVQPYVEFSFMNDKTHQEIAPSALFREQQPADGRRQLSDQLQQSAAERAAAGAFCALPHRSLPIRRRRDRRSASVEIGRRNIEGGGRQSDYEHTNYRGVAGVRGDIGPAWSYDAYAQYYYVQFYNTNNRYLNFERITNALQVKTGAGGAPVCISGPPCVPYNIFADGGVTQDALAYLYTDGTAYGTTTLRTVHADFTGDLGEYGVKHADGDTRACRSTSATRLGGRTSSFKPDEAELSGLLSGFGGASVAIDESIECRRILRRGARSADPGQDAEPQDLSIDVGYRSSDYSTSGSRRTPRSSRSSTRRCDSARLRAS